MSVSILQAATEDSLGGARFDAFEDPFFWHVGSSDKTKEASIASGFSMAASSDEP